MCRHNNEARTNISSCQETLRLIDSLHFIWYSLDVALSSTSAYQGSWDSIHVFEVRERGRQAHYSLTSTVLLWINTQVSSGSGQDEGSVGDVSLSGSMTRQVSVVDA